jgi:DNA invertase Pin-like site-specific DNA recombinase
MKFIAYMRVSTDEQSLGLDAQKFACESYCQKLGHELGAVFSDEGLSGALPFTKRAGIMNAIASLNKGDVLLVAKRDRLVRGDVLAMAMLEAAVVRKKARIVSVAGEGTENEDPSSVLMRRMVDAFGEYERSIIKSRTSAALQAKKSKGQRVGHIPFGHRLAADGVHLEMDELEQEILQQMRDLRQSGLTYREIAQEMNNKKAFNRGGKNWLHESVYKMMKRAA